jgi:hypothetical protein
MGNLHYLRGRSVAAVSCNGTPCGGVELDWGCGVTEGLAWLWLGGVVVAQ